MYFIKMCEKLEYESFRNRGSIFQKKHITKDIYLYFKCMFRRLIMTNYKFQKLLFGKQIIAKIYTNI